MPEDDKKKVKVRPGYNPRTNAMRTRREGAPGSGTRQGKANRGGQGQTKRADGHVIPYLKSPGKATRGGQGQTKPVDLGKALKKGFNKTGELVRKGGDWLEKGNEGKPSPYIGLEKRYKNKKEWLEDQKKK